MKETVETTTLGPAVGAPSGHAQLSRLKHLAGCFSSAGLSLPPVIINDCETVAANCNVDTNDAENVHGDTTHDAFLAPVDMANHLVCVQAAVDAMEPEIRAKTKELQRRFDAHRAACPTCAVESNLHLSARCMHRTVDVRWIKRGKHRARDRNGEIVWWHRPLRPVPLALGGGYDLAMLHDLAHNHERDMVREIELTARALRRAHQQFARLRAAVLSIRRQLDSKRATQ